VIVHDAGGTGGVAASLAAAGGAFFFPDYLGWWLGPHAWVTRHAHELLVAVAFACAGLWWLVHRRRPEPVGAPVADGLMLLALVLLLRAALDPWNNTYYELPFVFALIAAEHGRHPRLLLLGSVLFACLLTLVVWPGAVYLGDVKLRVAAYDALALPAIALLALRAYGPRTRLWATISAQLPVSGSGLASGRWEP
jgi:hypothetical protein